MRIGFIGLDNIGGAIVRNLIVSTLALCACSSSLDERQRLSERLGIEGRISDHTYIAPDDAFSVAVHRDAHEWLDGIRPKRPDNSYGAGVHWVRDGHRNEAGGRVAYVIFRAMPDAAGVGQRSYDAYHVEVTRPREAAPKLAMQDRIEQAVTEQATRYYERFGHEVTAKRLARADIESGGRRITHAAYLYEIRATVVPGVLAREYRAYANFCLFEVSQAVVSVVSEVVVEGRGFNEKERAERVSRDGCDLAWLATVVVGAPSPNGDSPQG